MNNSSRYAQLPLSALEEQIQTRKHHIQKHQESLNKQNSYSRRKAVIIKKEWEKQNDKNWLKTIVLNHFITIFYFTERVHENLKIPNAAKAAKFFYKCLDMWET